MMGSKGEGYFFYGYDTGYEGKGKGGGKGGMMSGDTGYYNDDYYEKGKGMSMKGGMMGGKGGMMGKGMNSDRGTYYSYDDTSWKGKGKGYGGKGKRSMKGGMMM
jgi:hypothetical protein